MLSLGAVNLPLLPEDGDKKTSYGNANRFLSDRLQLFVPSADKSSLRLFLTLGLCPLFSLIFICCNYGMCTIPRQCVYSCVCGVLHFGVIAEDTRYT